MKILQKSKLFILSYYQHKTFKIQRCMDNISVAGKRFRNIYIYIYIYIYTAIKFEEEIELHADLRLPFL